MYIEPADLLVQDFPIEEHACEVALSLRGRDPASALYVTHQQHARADGWKLWNISWETWNKNVCNPSAARPRRWLKIMKYIMRNVE